MQVSCRREVHNPVLPPLFVHCTGVCPAEDFGSVEAEAGAAATDAAEVAGAGSKLPPLLTG